MPISQLRQNVRNYLYGLTLPEILTTLSLSVIRGEGERTDFIREYILVVWDDCEGCTGHPNCKGCPGRDASITCVECGASLGCPHNADCYLDMGDPVELEDCIDITGWRG